MIEERTAEQRRLVNDATDAVFCIEDAVKHLTSARELFKQAGAVQTTARVRKALTSGHGALRHARRILSGLQRGEKIRRRKARGSLRGRP